MSPINVSRRRFLGCSAAASLALAGGDSPNVEPLRVGLIGLGNRGTTLLRTLLTIEGVEVVAIHDPERRHAERARGITQKAGRPAPEAVSSVEGLTGRPDVQAVVAAVPCDLHHAVNLAALRAGKHLYAEKPLALTVEQCDSLLAEAHRHPSLVFHAGHQRRSNPRVAAGIEAIRSGRLGELIEARGAWTSSNGPLRGHQNWLGRRERSGDWMVEQAVHVWDTLHALAGEPPMRAAGVGRTGLFAATDPDRDVHDWYTCQLSWRSGFVATFTQSWVDPADDAFTGASLRVIGTAGGYDFASGAATFRDRKAGREIAHPGPIDDTLAALRGFVGAIRGETSAPPLSLAEAREAVVTGWMVRRAIDERRPVDRAEVAGGPAPDRLS